MPDNIKTENQIMMELNQKIVREVEEFISYFDGTQDNFLHGNCFWFAVILKERFNPWYVCNIMYNPVDNHFAAYIHGMLFDAGGLRPEQCPFDGWRLWEKFEKEEYIEARRIYRDCVYHMTPEQWENLSFSQRNGAVHHASYISSH